LKLATRKSTFFSLDDEPSQRGGRRQYVASIALQQRHVRMRRHGAGDGLFRKSMKSKSLRRCKVIGVSLGMEARRVSSCVGSLVPDLERTLTKGQITKLNQITADLDRGRRRQAAGKVSGSDIAANLTTKVKYP
jgi:hypothetical protein